MKQIDFSSFTLPRFHEIPNVGLYLKQVVVFINDATEPLLHTSVTPTMLSNYVKLHLVSNPTKKMYNREQIASLLFIVLVKNILSLDNIRQLLTMQASSTETSAAYDYFCTELEHFLRQISGETTKPVLSADETDTEEKHLLQNVIITLVQKIYLDEYFREFSQ